MIGLDTNVVVRFLVQDEPRQSALATRLITGLSKDEPGFISAVVLAEITWVLSRAYRTGRDGIAAAVEGLLRSAEMRVENAEAAWRALAVYAAGRSVEFADAFIAETNRLAGVSKTVTFDRTAAAEGGCSLLA